MNLLPFRDLFKRTRRPALASVGAAGVDGGLRRLDGDDEVLVKGESHYQDALSAICGGKCEEGYYLPVTATLQAEPTNPYDPRAIAVSVGGRLVGYLPRDTAATMHSEFIGLTAGSPVACGARVVGGWLRSDGDEGSFGVQLMFRPHHLAFAPRGLGNAAPLTP